MQSSTAAPRFAPRGRQRRMRAAWARALPLPRLRSSHRMAPTNSCAPHEPLRFLTSPTHPAACELAVCVVACLCTRRSEAHAHARAAYHVRVLPVDLHIDLPVHLLMSHGHASAHGHTHAKGQALTPAQDTHARRETDIRTHSSRSFRTHVEHPPLRGRELYILWTGSRLVVERRLAGIWMTPTFG